jgi:hypothetical protein
MLGSDALEMAPQVGLDDAREHGDPALVALVAADNDLVAREIQVLDAEPTALEHPEAGTVEQAGHEARHPVEAVEHGADLLPRENDGQALWTLGPHETLEPREIAFQHVPVEEQESAQGLVLGGGGGPAAHKAGPQGLADAVKKARFRRREGAAFAAHSRTEASAATWQRSVPGYGPRLDSGHSRVLASTGPSLRAQRAGGQAVRRMDEKPR